MKFSDPRPPTKLFFLALLVRFKVAITKFFYFLIQLYTSRNWRFRNNFFDSDQKRFFYDFFVFEICRHFVPPFAFGLEQWRRFKNSYSSQAKWFGCIFLDRGKYTVENAWEMCFSMLQKVAYPKKNISMHVLLWGMSDEEEEKKEVDQFRVGEVKDVVSEEDV